MDTIPTEDTFSEALSRDYFVDIVLGLEFRESYDHLRFSDRC